MLHADVLLFCHGTGLLMLEAQQIKMLRDFSLG